MTAASGTSGNFPTQPDMAQDQPKTIKRSRSILQLGLRRGPPKEAPVEPEQQKQPAHQPKTPKTPKTPKFSLSPFPSGPVPTTPGRPPLQLTRNQSVEALRTPFSEIGVAIGSPSDAVRRRDYFAPQPTTTSTPITSSSLNPNSHSKPNKNGGVGPMGLETEQYGFSTSISANGMQTPYTPFTPSSGVTQASSNEAGASGWRRLFGKGLFSKKGTRKLVKANPPPDVVRGENYSRGNTPVSQSSNSSKISVDDEYKRYEIVRTDTPNSLMLEVDIPKVEMERYSVMFGNVLLPKRNGSLYSRRRSRMANEDVSSCLVWKRWNANMIIRNMRNLVYYFQYQIILL